MIGSTCVVHIPVTLQALYFWYKALNITGPEALMDHIESQENYDYMTTSAEYKSLSPQELLLDQDV